MMFAALLDFGSLEGPRDARVVRSAARTRRRTRRPAARARRPGRPRAAPRPGPTACRGTFALASTEAASRPNAGAAASAHLHGISTCQPRRRRDPSLGAPRGESARGSRWRSTRRRSGASPSRAARALAAARSRLLLRRPGATFALCGSSVRRRTCRGEQKRKLVQAPLVDARYGRRAARARSPVALDDAVRRIGPLRRRGRRTASRSGAGAARGGSRGQSEEKGEED